ncbi:MAG: hypothetical protein LBP34_00695 [Flavobacteriaceae bacterium]|jgi:hypothetical protein|nr:hypothetical protein [Flavobacteriaceae bacterium]
MKKLIQTNIKNTIALFISFIFILTSAISCSDDDDSVVADIKNSVPEHEHAEITKVVLKFTDAAKKEYKFDYVAPEGTTTLPITEVNVPAGTYDVEISFHYPHGDHFHSITDEVFIDDADDHFVLYQKIDGPKIDIVYADDDAIDTLGNKLGRYTTWTISGEGKVYIHLIHQPVKKDPNALSAAQLGGEIDLEAHFDVKILK